MRALVLADSARMTTGEEAARVAERRERLGLSRSKLAALAGVDRETLAKVEGGQEVTAAKLRQILAVLDERERDYGLGPETQPAEQATSLETIEFVVEGDFGVKVTVRGPITNREDLQAAAAEIIRSIRGDRPEG